MDMEQVNQFLKKHMLKSRIPDYEYLVEGLFEAEKIKNGEVFDELRAIVLVNEMQEAQETIRFMKKSLNHKTELYDVSEQLTFPGGRLSAGVFIGAQTVKELISVALLTPFRLW